MSKSLWFAGGALLTLLVLSGCATLSREECVRGDWYQIGVSDGQRGFEFNRIDQHRRACQNTPAVVDEGAYRAGRDAGLTVYCTVTSGYQVGSNGDQYANVCPPATAPQFLQGYALGQQVADARRALRNAESRVGRLNREIEELEDERDDAENTLELSEEQVHRSNARNALQRIRLDRQRLDFELRDAQSDVFEAEQNLQFVQESTFAQLQSLQGL